MTARRFPETSAEMPYNTRRKSLSLAELGIQVPKRARAPSQPSQPSQPSLPAVLPEAEEPQSKKAKRSHASPSPGAMSPPRTTNIRIKQEQQPKAVAGVEHTPPPSPGGVAKVDTEGIKDDIVVGVIKQLEATGNRPHTSKELAAVLANSVTTIETSTNPNALIQARLAAYLKGPWPLFSRCPLGKQQENIHPRRVFYYLTTSPHQPIPESSNPIPVARRVISPSLSSATGEEIEEKYNRERKQLSPSPEVDLSSPELDDDRAESGSSFSARNSLPRDHPPTCTNLAHNRRADSPPLEREERDFKQTANELQEQRRNSRQQSEPSATTLAMIIDNKDDADSVSMSIEVEDETDENADARRNSEAVAVLFGNASLSASMSTAYEFSSPIIKPQTPSTHAENKLLPAIAGIDHVFSSNVDPDALSLDLGKAADVMDVWDAWNETGHLQSPENVDLDELECMFDAY